MRDIKIVRASQKKVIYVTKSGETRQSYTYAVTIPKEVAEEYGLKKEKEYLATLVGDAIINGKKVRAIIFVKPNEIEI